MSVPAAPATRFDTANGRWNAVRRRDCAADGVFYYGVVSTGVYCRPSCGARTPRRENVRFFATPEAAERAGLRACRRCRPDSAGPSERQGALVARACRMIGSAETAPDLARLARAAHLSPFHFHRLFKRITGLTPGEYRRAHRAARLRERLPHARRIADASYDAGFGSLARLYAASTSALGMSPHRYRSGGTGEAVRFAFGRCSLGTLLVAATDRGICAVLLGDDRRGLLQDLRERLPKARLLPAEAAFGHTVAAIAALVESPDRRCALPLDLRGTAFQLRVWHALQTLPAGRTASYAELARRVGRPRAARAVARAVGANPAAVIVPCHRIVRSDGTLGGYRWGTPRKRVLLERERLLPARATSRPGPKASGSRD